LGPKGEGMNKRSINVAEATQPLIPRPASLGVGLVAALERSAAVVLVLLAAPRV
jgi:hypothetical protein